MPRPVRSPYDEGKDWLNDSRAEAMSSGFLHQATVTLDNDQIIHLPTTVIELVEAQGENKIIVPVRVVAILNASAGVYTGVTDASWVLMWGSTGSQWASAVRLAQTTLGLAQSTFIEFQVVSLLQVAGGTFDTEIVTANNRGLTSVSDKPLTIKDDYAGVPDYGDGNVANTLTVSVAYYVLNTVTGEFE